MTQRKVLVLGASGYIGQHLVSRLLEAGYQVRAAARLLDKLYSFPWAKHDHVELCKVDILQRADLENALKDIQTVFYLVHSMNPQTKDFAQTDRDAAINMVESAKASGVEHIIYLGGLGDEGSSLSKHLRSRAEVSHILHSGGVPTTTLRAAMIIGRGSISFEILRSLVDRLPVMVTPRWVNTESQPIAIDNVLVYLMGCLNVNETKGQIFDIGGPDIVSYRQLMDLYAQEKGIFRRIILSVPIMTPTLSSYWIQFVTPYPNYIARPLAEGLRNRVICQDNRIKSLIPQHLISCREAIHKALKEEV